MAARVSITPAGPGRYEVEVRDGPERTHHVVELPPELLSELGEGVEEQEVVRVSFDYLLEREPAGSILARFSLAVIERYFPGYRAELGRRLG